MTSSHTTNTLNTAGGDDLGTLPMDILLPERPSIIGEFSPAYEAFKAATLSRRQVTNMSWHCSLSTSTGQFCSARRLQMSSYQSGLRVKSNPTCTPRY